MAKDDSKNVDFEKDLARLESLIEELESGDLNLEQGVEHYRKGVELLGTLNRSLSAAEQRVEELTTALQAELADLDQDADDA